MSRFTKNISSLVLGILVAFLLTCLLTLMGCYNEHDCRLLQAQIAGFKDCQMDVHCRLEPRDYEKHKRRMMQAITHCGGVDYEDPV
jgi:hypothetical protein